MDRILPTSIMVYDLVKTRIVKAPPLSVSLFFSASLHLHQFLSLSSTFLSSRLLVFLQIFIPFSILFSVFLPLFIYLPPSLVLSSLLFCLSSVTCSILWRRQPRPAKGIKMTDWPTDTTVAIMPRTFLSTQEVLTTDYLTGLILPNNVWSWPATVRPLTRPNSRVFGWMGGTSTTRHVWVNGGGWTSATGHVNTHQIRIYWGIITFACCIVA